VCSSSPLRRACLPAKAGLGEALLTTAVCFFHLKYQQGRMNQFPDCKF
jgi:hypothetical protein